MMLTTTETEAVLASAGLVEGLASPVVRARIATAVHLEETGRRMLAFYLVEMQDKHLYNDVGCASAAQFAERKHEIPERRGRELVALGRKLLGLPVLDAAFCRGEIGWAKLVLVSRVASPAHEEAWLQRAKDLSCAKLKLQVALHREGDAPRDPNDQKGTPEIRYTHTARVDPLTHQLIEQAKQMLSDECGAPVSDKQLLHIAAELVLGSEDDGTIPGRNRVSASAYKVILHSDAKGRLHLDTDEGLIFVNEGGIASDAEILHVEDEYPAGERPGGGHADDACRIDVPKIAPPTPAPLRAAILARDGHRCACCRSRKGLHVHHIVWRSKGGQTRGANGITLCRQCHARVHAGLLVLSGPDARHIRFLDRDGRPLHEPGERVKAHDLPRLEPPEPRSHPEEEGGTEQAAEEVVCLETVPEKIDGVWWWRHADLFRLRDGGGLELRPGRPGPTPEEEPRVAPDPDGAFAGLVGKDDLMGRLGRWAKAAEIEGRSFPHTLFLGPPGTGKTTIARRLARRIGGRLHATSGPLVTEATELLRVLAALREGDVLLLDEIHAVPPRTLEILYEAMAERRVALVLRQGVRSKTVCLELPAFTLLAATTEDGNLHEALRSRFGRIESLGYYDEWDLETLVMAQADARGFTLDRVAARALVWYVRGTPREANGILSCAMDEALVRGVRVIDDELIFETAEQLGFDPEGRTRDERRYLTVLDRERVPVPLSRLARELGMSEKTIVERIEPFLFRRGYVRMTPRGREFVSRYAVRLVRQA